MLLVAYVTATYFNVGYDYKSILIRVATFGTTAFSLVWTFVIFEKNHILIIKGFLRKIGDASYTLYLCHTILLSLFYSTGLRNYMAEADMALLGFILYLLSIILFSLAFYKLIELPLYKKIRSKL